MLGLTSLTQPNFNNMVESRLATFAAGCFWGIEEAFRRSGRCLSTSVGYTGGHTASPTYRQVCSGTTGHAEACQLRYDPSGTAYEDLLRLFWSIHDPTQLNRQGPDKGTQYRSAIFYHSEEQRAAAEESKRTEQAKRQMPVVTEIVPAGEFWRAEDYHQQYIASGNPAACHM
jgi:peptide-methionine (S)-S-oxide reductase